VHKRIYRFILSFGRTSDPKSAANMFRSDPRPRSAVTATTAVIRNIQFQLTLFFKRKVLRHCRTRSSGS
jgi:hypothetical protein